MNDLIAIAVLTSINLVIWIAADVIQINNGRPINHPWEWTWRVIFSIILLWIFGLLTIINFLFSYFLFFLVFDPALNIVRGKPFFYLGQGAWWDRFTSEDRYLFFAIECVLVIGTGLIIVL